MGKKGKYLPPFLDPNIDKFLIRIEKSVDYPLAMIGIISCIFINEEEKEEKLIV